MHIDGFRSAASRSNAIVVVDLKSAQVKVRNNHVLNRAFTWLQRRFSPNPLRDTERSAAHNRFLQAIADRHSGYDSADVNRARELLADDVLERKPLSSRRIREVLDDLDGRSSATTRINRRVAAYFHDEMGISNTLAARDLAALPRDDQADGAESDYSDEVDTGPLDPTSDPDGPTSTSEPGTTREEIMPEALTHPPPTESAAVPESVTPPALAAQRTAQLQTARAEVGTTDQPSAKPKDLTRELTKAKLPGAVATHLKKLIGAREIVDRDSLAKHGNKSTAGWVVKNRVGRWYVEAWKDKNVKKMAKREGTVSVPSSLLNDVAKSITDSPALRKYPDIKVQARDMIAAHVKQEIDQETQAHRGAVPTKQRNERKGRERTTPEIRSPIRRQIR